MVFPSIFGTMFVQDGFAKQASAARAKQLADAEAEEKRIAACLGIEFGRRNERAWETNFSEYLKPTWMNLWESVHCSVRFSRGRRKSCTQNVMSWFWENHRALACETKLIKAKEAAEKQKADPDLFLTQKHTFFNAFQFLSQRHGRQLGVVFFADPTFPKLGCPPFLGIQEKDKGGKEKEKSEDSGHRLMLKSEAAFGEPY